MVKKFISAGLLIMCAVFFLTSCSQPIGPVMGAGEAKSLPVSTATPPADDILGAPAWDASAVYNAGDVVSHAGREWTAMWWTQGDEPGIIIEWGVWR